VAVESLVLPGYEAMMAEPHETVVTREALESMAQWIKVKAPPMGKASPVAASALTQSMHTGPVKESMQHISRDPDLFGIMTEPAGSGTTLPWIVILNAGAAYRIGPGRLHVPLARQLAELGYPCLRIDINGIGDSVAADPAQENDAYAATAFRDVSLVCDHLHTLQPDRPIVLMGLCSGAYVAFQSAAQLPGPAIIESILINPLVFFWRKGMVINDTNMDQLVAWREYRRAIFKWSHWKMLLTGKTRTGFTGSIKRFAGHVRPLLAKLGRKALKKAPADGPAGCGHPARQDLPGDLRRVAAASRTLAMFVSDNDPGHFLLMHQARREAVQMMRQGSLQCRFIHDADHTFSIEQARRRFHSSLLEYLHQRFGSGRSPG
jgi:pimeloyl-ACP methyl ester carboxylesterase